MSFPLVTNANNVQIPLLGQKRSCPSVSINSPERESLNSASKTDRKIILNTLHMKIGNNLIKDIQDINSKIDILKVEMQNQLTRFKLVNYLEADTQACKDLLKMGDLEEVNPEFCETALLFSEELIQFAQTFKMSITKINQLKNELKDVNARLRESNRFFEQQRNDIDREEASNPLQQNSTKSKMQKKRNSNSNHHSPSGPTLSNEPVTFTSSFSPNFVNSFLQVPIIPVHYVYPANAPLIN